uniref:NADH dehydrogenase subunit 4L n=1 Tax=Capsala katsuwoni TaxID=2904576 RepID=A0A8T9JGG7_9PLAT|nr:NADH dehydrogenase subunit 4L [Capsala katsuwoni]UOK11872.1 NADH dehydrogenase subunit 4L [Capsala katsuwoni]
MILFYLLGLFVCFFSFFLSSFQFLSILVVLENLNVLILFISSIVDSGSGSLCFLVFIVVATIEVTLSLVVLSRLWSQNLITS